MAEVRELYRLIGEELERDAKTERLKLDYLVGKILQGVQQMLRG